MLARSSIKTRLSTLEAYVDVPKEPRGMTVTGRLDAQHTLLLALRTDVTELRADVTELRTEVKDLRTGLIETNRRLSDVEVTIGTVLHGVTEIKNLLKPPDGLPDDPLMGPSSNGHPPPHG